ncbi:olfactory receptor 2T5-like [Manis javanica]|uniref:olfactory receptor 2T5-like n=1 Tax=Manis javanica TaxID=9974 RepID=UPI003C6D9BBD
MEILLIRSEARLHTPMYFLISQLCLMDVTYISVTVPKMLVDQVTGVNTISAPGCGMQMFLYVTLSGSEFLFPAVIGYDCYAAIWRPSHYPVLMNHRACILLASGSGTLASVDGSLFTPITMTFPFCRSREIHHFFCEVPAVMKLSCSDTSMYETLIYLCCVLMLLIPVTIISGSCGFILLTIHRMNSAEGRKKAFATCSSHMTVVTLFYGVVVYTYMLPSSNHTPEKDMVVSVLYIILTPVLNPVLVVYVRVSNRELILKNRGCDFTMLGDFLKEKCMSCFLCFADTQCWVMLQDAVDKGPELTCSSGHSKPTATCALAQKYSEPK